MTLTGWIFDEDARKRVEDCRTHEFQKLIENAGMRDELNASLKASAVAGGEFASNWIIVSAWKVASRYESKTETEAKQLVAAITVKPHGVMAWIRNYW
jgi:hypothetical protein